MWPSKMKLRDQRYRASGVIHPNFGQKVVGILSGQRVYLRDLPEDKQHVEQILKTIDQMPSKGGIHRKELVVGDTK